MSKSQQKITGTQRHREPQPNQRNKINLQKPNLKKWRSINHLREFKITILNMHNELKDNTERQLNEIRKMMHEK